jgi:hypothetical protein
MHPAISYELAKARITDLRHQAQRDALARPPNLASTPCPAPPVPLDCDSAASIPLAQC